MVGGIVTSFGVFVLLAHLGRDLGKLKERELFKSWDGQPSIKMLRHRDDFLSPLLKSAYHQKLNRLIDGLRIPTREEEIQDEMGADEIYEVCVNFLRENTRDKEKFPLIFNENVNYGFRRNLWGLKPAGLVCSFIGCLGSTLAYGELDNSLIPILTMCLNSMLFTFWLIRINPGWIKMVAESYAQRLLAACEVL